MVRLAWLDFVVAANQTYFAFVNDFDELMFEINHTC
jgi:hypothetical protein